MIFSLPCCISLTRPFLSPLLPYYFSFNKPSFSIPDFIGSPAPEGVADSDPVDFVFVGFNQAQVLETLNGLQSSKNYTDADVLPYTDVLSNAVLGIYAEKFWN